LEEDAVDVVDVDGFVGGADEPEKGTGIAPRSLEKEDAM
jgi:hypothetical protein